LKPLPGAQAGLAALQDVAEVYVVTSYVKTSPTWVYERDRWLHEHFYVPRSHVIHTRAKHCFSGAALIDDKPENVEAWAQHQPGLPVLWGQPFNANHSASPRVIRTNSWARVIELLQEKV